MHSKYMRPHSRNLPRKQYDHAQELLAYNHVRYLAMSAGAAVIMPQFDPLVETPAH
jgi:hypothetical protein